MELVPKRVTNELSEVLDPISPELTDNVVNFAVNELKKLFRELSEHRSSSEGKARQVLSRYQERLLTKLGDELPEREVQVEKAYELLNNVYVKHFENQKGKKYL